jgi:YegS/Rv2252/BmrU family lipid kinase
VSERRPTALLLANSGAGSATPEAIAAVHAALDEGFDVTRETCDGRDELRGVLTSFDGGHIIVAGGDGSLHTLVNVLAEVDRLSSTTVGLVPMGTANDFATGLGVPQDPAVAARACVGASAAPMDLLQADDGDVVINAAHAGIGAVASDRAQAAKPVVGALAYPLAALATGATTPGYQLEVTVDGTTVHDGTTLFTLAANGPCLGGGARLCGGADPSDGVLDVLVIGDVAVTDRPGLALALQRGTHTDHTGVAQHRGTTLRVRGDATDHSRDGEVRSGLHDVTYVLRPAAWRMLRSWS